MLLTEYEESLKNSWVSDRRFGFLAYSGMNRLSSKEEYRGLSIIIQTMLHLKPARYRTGLERGGGVDSILMACDVIVFCSSALLSSSLILANASQ